jgi:hypothetical protein
MPLLKVRPDELVHVTRYDGEDFGVLEVYEVMVVKFVLCHHRFVRLWKTNVSLYYST